MKKSEWFAATDLRQMWDLLWRRVSDRKLRLFAVGCYRTVCDGTETAKSRRSVEVAELYADGLAAAERLARARSAGTKAVEWLAARSVSQNVTVELNADLIQYLGRQDARIAAMSPVIFRDMFCYPLFPVTLNPSWLTSTVVSLANQMYDARDFSAMPILADALQDAGCDNEDVLSHCRGDSPHVRGCWVVDLILGKS